MDEAYTIARIMLRDRSVLVSLAAGSLVLAPLFAGLARRRRWSRGRALAAALAGVGLAGMLALTLGRWVQYHPDLRWRGCGFGSPLGLLDGEAILNWMVLAPASFFAMLALRRLAVVATFALAVPVTVEVVQSLVSLGTCQTVDVIRNCGGGLLGAFAAGALLGLGRVSAIRSRPRG